MFSRARPFVLTLVVLGLTFAAACVRSAESGSLRDGLRARGADRQAVDVRQVRSGDARSVTITQDGRERSFLVHVPAGGLPARPGAVLVFHGGRGAADRVMESSGMNAAADQGGFLAVYPDAGGERWNNGKNATAGGGDDVGFVRAIIARLQQDYGVDPSRVFATGISNGGGFVYKLACDAPGLLAAIAPIAANMSEALRADCAPGQGTPVAMFSGTADPLMPYQGGRPKLDKQIQRALGPATDEMVSSPDTAGFWARLNGCAGTTSTEVSDASNDGTTVTRISYTGCSGPGVILYRINGGGHTWPGSASPDRRITGPTSHDIDATATMVRFFAGYGL